MENIEESEVWYIDFGCSTHMASEQELFTRIKDDYYGKVVCDDHSVSEVKSKSVVAILALHGNKND